MSDRTPTNVSAAFDMLLEEMEQEIELTNALAGRLVEQSNYSEARDVIDRAVKMTDMRTQLEQLRRMGVCVR